MPPSVLRCMATVQPLAMAVSANDTAAMGSHTPGAASVSATTSPTVSHVASVSISSGEPPDGTLGAFQGLTSRPLTEADAWPFSTPAVRPCVFFDGRSRPISARPSSRAATASANRSTNARRCSFASPCLTSGFTSMSAGSSNITAVPPSADTHAPRPAGTSPDTARARNARADFDRRPGSAASASRPDSSRSHRRTASRACIRRMSAANEASRGRSHHPPDVS